jgi:probable addiction module antidote protein
MAKKKSRIFAYDSAEYLDSTPAIHACREKALETDDLAFIADRLGTTARARGMPEITRETGYPARASTKLLAPSATRNLAPSCA